MYLPSSGRKTLLKTKIASLEFSGRNFFLGPGRNTAPTQVHCTTFYGKRTAAMSHGPLTIPTDCQYRKEIIDSIATL